MIIIIGLVVLIAAVIAGVGGLFSPTAAVPMRSPTGSPCSATT